MDSRCCRVVFQVLSWSDDGGGQSGDSPEQLALIVTNEVGTEAHCDVTKGKKGKWRASSKEKAESSRLLKLRIF